MAVAAPQAGIEHPAEAPYEALQSFVPL